MLVITSASQKGGAGKTTVAANLAICAYLNKKKVVLIDVDPQGTLSQWWEARENDEPSLLKTTISKLEQDIQSLKNNDFDICIIDTPPGIGSEIQTVISLSNFIIIPVKPSPNDLRAVGGTVELVKKYEKDFCFIISMAKPRANLTNQAIAALSAYGEVSTSIIYDRISYAESMIEGQTVLETDPKGKGSDEIKNLWKYITSKTVNQKTSKKTLELMG